MLELVERLPRELAGLDPRLLYPLVGLMVMLETTIFIGLVVPGDVVVLLAGSTVTGPGRFALLAGIAAAGSAVGETIGYLLGRHLGERLRDSRLGRRLGERRWAAAEAFLRGRGGRAVVGARFVAMVHAVLPVVAGSVRMPYWRFIGWCGAGSAVWAVLYVAVGAAAGASWRTVNDHLELGSYLLLAVVVGAVLAVRLARRRREPASRVPAGGVRRSRAD